MIAMSMIEKLFQKFGFSSLERTILPKTIQWKPDLVFKRNNQKYYVLIRNNNYIPPTFLSRISDSTSKFNTIIVFNNKCTKKDESEILSMGISIGYLINGKLTLKLKANQQKISKEINKKLTVIDIFLSSKQDIKEREFAKDRIEMLRQIHKHPFNPPQLIEHNKFDLRKLKQYINNAMDKCEWYILILEDNYSKIVSYELNRAIATIKHENIFIFVKSSKECSLNWKEELDIIKNLNPPTIKYLPYSDLATLESNLSRSINLRMSQIYKRKKIKSEE